MGMPGSEQWALGQARSADGPRSGWRRWRRGVRAVPWHLDAAAAAPILLMANNRAIMGDRVNGFWTNVPGWTTVMAIFSSSIGLVATWFL